MVLVVALVALAAGAIVGWAVARRASDAPVVAAPAPADERLPGLLDVLDGLSTGVVIVDGDGREVHRNAAARALTGTHAGVLVDDAVERHLRRARRGEATHELLELYGPPKSVVTVRATPVPGDGAYAFVDDISERRRIDAVRTDFVANISHELKTPVGALAVLAETLADEQDPDVVRRVADRMLEEAHRAARTIDDLLELSRIELGDEQEHGPVDVDDVVRYAIERVAALAEQHDIRVVAVRPDEAHVTIWGDRRQLVSALGNLVENAVKYSESGDRVEVRVRRDAEHVELSVADQGVGIPARDLDRIFERFYRVDKARSRGTGGTGLGLSIVRHVATNHRGEVTVTSREGEGSTFVLRLPVGAAGPGLAATVSTPHPQPDANGAQ